MSRSCIKGIIARDVEREPHQKAAPIFTRLVGEQIDLQKRITNLITALAGLEMNLYRGRTWSALWSFHGGVFVFQGYQELDASRTSKGV